MKNKTLKRCAALFLAFAICGTSAAIAQSPAPATPDLRPANPHIDVLSEDMGARGMASPATLSDCFRLNMPDACQQAAERGNAEAMRRVALAYYNGTWNYPRDMAAFLDWLDKAARARSLPAQMMLATAYAGKLKDSGINDPMLAYVWFHVAAARTTDGKKKYAMIQSAHAARRKMSWETLTRAEALRDDYIRQYGSP